jgi:N-ethylmaleimide reductase
MTPNDIKQVLDDYKTAAENAKKAGFDGVELSAGHGYLID